MDRLRNVGRMHTIVIWNVKIVGLQREQVVDEFPWRYIECLDKIAILVGGKRTGCQLLQLLADA